MSPTDSPTLPTPSHHDRWRPGHRSAPAGPPARAADAVAVASVLLAGAIFGFFYAWVCSTMWGLDAADPRVAIEAMQAMNASVRNAVFFPAFFLTPVVLGAAAVLMRLTARRRAVRWFAAAAIVYLFGGLLLTVAVNVPMNEALATVTVPSSRNAAETIWSGYSDRWQVFNTLRTVASGAALLLAAIGLRLSGDERELAPHAADRTRGEPQP